MSTIITWVFFIWVCYKLYRVVKKGSRSLSEWSRDRRWKTEETRYQKWNKEVSADPVAKKLIQEDADWLSSTK